jgi:hypothetical protein
MESARGGDLLEEFHEKVNSYIQNVIPSDLSELRSEICQRIQRRSQFQLSSFGAVSKDFDEAPLNLYSSLTVGLYLIVFEDGQFQFSSAVPGFSSSGHIDDEEGRSLLFYIGHGMLQTGLLPKLMDIGLTWYDGCLICEVVDQRRRLGRAVRTQLRVAQEDLTSFGLEAEQQVLLQQYPLLCVDPDPQVGRLSRLAFADRQRWEASGIDCESKMAFVSRISPGLFLNKNLGCERKGDGKRLVQEYDEFRRLMIDKLMQKNPESGGGP